ncbi:hypothetical protein ABXV22_26270 [Vibrio rotiferianus]|uniref:DUF6892 domain-containing protein n=1 Tax=Vibrio rotiferianus TaxID=190895 RepID=A0A7Y3ZD76_9VIBR|nr:MULTISPECIES: hypothetical protein [Vibrio]MDV5054682.1 hypothetical protein [Vibrio sp. T13N]NOH50883.1 hypothetical protein [Vibrio rotiferianus]
MNNENLKLLILGDLYDSDDQIKNEMDKISAMNLHDLVYGNNAKYGWFDCISEVKELLLSINISSDQLAKVKLLSGECCATHFMIMPNWDGEGDEFDLTSFTGIESLTNLECLELLELSKVSNTEKLLELNIEEISSCSSLDPGLERELRARGVLIT